MSRWFSRTGRRNLTGDSRFLMSAGRDACGDLDSSLAAGEWPHGWAASCGGVNQGSANSRLRTRNGNGVSGRKNGGSNNDHGPGKTDG
jgi:hypothetical protein